MALINVCWISHLLSRARDAAGAPPHDVPSVSASLPARSTRAVNVSMASIPPCALHTPELGSNTSARDFLPRESTAQGADGLDGFGSCLGIFWGGKPDLT